MNKNRIKIWTFAVLLAFLFAASGFSKLSGADLQIRNFESWAYPQWTRIPIGLAELMLAAGLLWPKMRLYAILLNFAWVILAVWTHLQSSPAQYGAVSAPLLILAVNILLLMAVLKKPEESNTSGTNKS